MSTPGGRRPSPLARLTRFGTHRAAIATATAAALVFASVVPATAQAAAPAGPGAATSASAPATKGSTSARALCETEVANGHARCFAMVQEVNGAVPHLDLPNGYGPTEIQSAYSLPPNGGAGMVIGIVDAYDNPNAETDLAFYRQTFGLAPLAAGQFRKVNQRGGTDYPVPDAGWAGEISLDLDAVTSVAPNATIVLVEADSNAFEDLGTAVNQAVAQGAKFVSNSYGTGYSTTPGSGEDDTLLPVEAQYYNHPGVVITASTGDDDYGVSFPASSQYVTAVGGTSLVQDSSTRGWSESVWHNSYGGPGSGCSVVFDKPAFQTDTGCNKRSVGDVSAVADPETGLAVYNTYQAPGWAQYGGTSLSAPLIAATYALGGNPVPGSYPNSYPYSAPAGGLNDVTTGINGTCTPSYLCTAVAGYDGPTGLGTPNGTTAFSAGPRGEIVGKITDVTTGAGIAGATVVVGTGDTAARAITAGDGTYTVSIAPGNYPVTVTAYGYRTATAGPVTVINGGLVTLNVRLRSVPSHTVSGRVSDGSGHAYPLYARIDVAGAPGGPIYTDPYTGQYSVDLPQGATFTLTVTSMYPGYLPGTSTFRVGSVDLVRDIRLKVDPDATAVAGYSIKATGTSENFDAGTRPDGWTVTNAGDIPGWVFLDAGNRGNTTGGSGGFAIVDSDHSGSGHSQDTYLTSPPADLSAVTAPVLEFDTYFKPIGSSNGVAELSTDGGTTWSTVWDAQKTLRSGHVKLPVPAAAGQAAVVVRFHYTGTWAWWWEVDNFFLGTKKWVPVHGGLVAGRVTDANTDLGVNGATVTADENPAVQGSSAPTSDPAIGDGFYWFFSPLTGSHPFTAKKGAYGPVTKPVNVGANATTHMDFSLPAGKVGALPGDISATLAWGASVSTNVTLTNTGGQPATVKLGEQAGGFVLQSRSRAPVTVMAARTSKLSAVVAVKKSGASTARPLVSAPAPAADAWLPAADYPTTIQDPVAATVDGVVYSVGGYTGAADTNALYAYDTVGGTWTTKAAAADTREAAAAGAISGTLVVTGGWGASGAPDGKTEIYDPAGNSWSVGAANPKPHAGAGRAVLNGKLYVIGGCSANACGSTDVQVYDAGANSWSSAGAYPESVAWQACGAIDGKIYCSGGTTDASSLTHAYVYDPGSDGWSPIADQPTDQWGAFSTAANGKLLVAGGAVNDGAAITNQGYAYDPTADAWAALPALGSALYRGTGALGFYAIGGTPGGLFTAPVKTVKVLPGYDQGGSEDVSWLSVDPTELTLAPGASETIVVTLDGGDPSITQPGTYTAALTVTANTPYPALAIPVTMTVQPPTSWGKITGKVTTGASIPVAGATVQIDSWATGYTLTTGADGRYALWLDQRNNPLTLIVAKDGYRPQVATVTITAGGTVVKNWVLVKK